MAVRPTAILPCRAWLFLVSLFLSLPALHPGCLDAAEKSPATILVKDALTTPGQPATVEAKLISKRLMLIAALGGEPLELVVDGKVVATALTGGDGRAFFTYTSKAQGLTSVQIRVGNSVRVDQAEGQANLAVWERRQPILMVEMASLLEEPTSNRVPPIGMAIESERKPMAEAADELGKLTQFYYRVIYVVTIPAGMDRFQKSAEVRDWLKSHKFPTGYVLTLPADATSLGAMIDELQVAGWKTIKIGVGRSKAFADAFLQRRLEAIIVPEPTKGDVPRKAKVAKDWKDVRKKL
jgi:hypothetical protein